MFLTLYLQICYDLPYFVLNFHYPLVIKDENLKSKKYGLFSFQNLHFPNCHVALPEAKTLKVM